MFLLLDGGMGRELQRIGAPFSQPLWSAQALLEAPDFVLQAHKNFIDAGCDVITVNSYACVPFHLGEALYQKEGSRLAEKAARIALQAAKESQTKITVAGCIPPAMGSYRPDLFDPLKALPIIQDLIKAQQEYVNVWLAETICSMEEFEVVYAALKTTPLPIYVAFSVIDNSQDEPTLRSGEKVAEIIPNVCRHDVAGILFNCSQPEVMLSAINTTKKIIDSTQKPIVLGAYANGFTTIEGEHEANNTLTQVRDLSPEDYAEYANNWLDAGSTMVGGCCAIFPDHIKQLDQLRKNKNYPDIKPD